MDMIRTEDITKARKEMSRRAITLALEGRWLEACQPNRQILQLCPDDVDALNRLGKALLELGQYTEARETFEQAIGFSPYNAITKKNLERLSHLHNTVPVLQSTKPVAPHPFIQDGGRSRVTVLQTPAPYEVLAKMTPGDEVTVANGPNRLVVENQSGEYLGQVEPKLAMRLTRLINGGNRYNAGIAKINYPEVSVIIWVSYRHPDLSGISSFPASGKGDYTPPMRDTLLNYDLGGELDEVEFGLEWQEADEPSSDGEASIPTTKPLNEEEEAEEE